MRNGERPAEVPAGLVEELRLREGRGAFDRPTAIQGLRQGDPVRVATGPFAAMVGRLQKIAAGERVYVLFELLGRSVKVQLPIEAVDPA